MAGEGAAAIRPSANRNFCKSVPRLWIDYSLHSILTEHTQAFGNPPKAVFVAKVLQFWPGKQRYQTWRNPTTLLLAQLHLGRVVSVSILHHRLPTAHNTAGRIKAVSRPAMQQPAIV